MRPFHIKKDNQPLEKLTDNFRHFFEWEVWGLRNVSLLRLPLK